MLFTERMKKMELLIMKSDVDSVLRYLGNAGCVQLITEPGEQRELSAEEREFAELQVKIEALAHFLDVRQRPPGPCTLLHPRDRCCVSAR